MAFVPPTEGLNGAEKAAKLSGAEKLAGKAVWVDANEPGAYQKLLAKGLSPDAAHMVITKAKLAASKLAASKSVVGR